MKATINDMNKPAKFNYSDRKAKHFKEQYTGYIIENGQPCTAVILRIYQTDAKVYCWFLVNKSFSDNGEVREVYRSASGNAGGYGYHKASAAAAVAIKRAGIVLDEEIAGRGNTAIEEAIYAIAKELTTNSDAIIFVGKAEA